MLKEAIGRRKDNTVSTIVGNPSFGRLLAALLGQWGCRRCAAESARLVLVEEGCRAPAKAPVHPLPPIPLSLPELWSTVENFFRTPPRRHTRISLKLPASVLCRGRVSETTLISLSDMGARFGYGRELATGEALLLRMEVEGRELRLDARVIYVIHRGEFDGSENVDIGVIFDGAGEELRRTLRNHIFGVYLERARSGLSPEAFAEALSFLQLPENVSNRMGPPLEP